QNRLRLSAPAKDTGELNGLFSKARLLSGGASDRFNGDGGHSGAIVQVDIFHRVMAVMVAGPRNIVILHEQYDRNAGIGKDLAVGVVQGAARIVGQANFAM